MINQQDLMDIYRALHPTTEYTFFSSTHGTYTKTDNMLGPPKPQQVDYN